MLISLLKNTTILWNFVTKVPIFWSISINIALYCCQTGIDMLSYFLSCSSYAEMSGKLLAHSLMMQFPFKDQSISLVGFSLGTHVIYNCLKELNRFGANNLIHNVYFIGGATSVKNINRNWTNNINQPIALLKSAGTANTNWLPVFRKIISCR